MGSIGTPIIAVESGIVENLGWNQYGGWRVGIRSFDTKRYYYYAHLRKNHPYSEGLEEGKIVKAGDVIGYLGMTGYSTKENVNNINVPHLHFGMQLIFDESQVDSPNEIWIDVYQIVEFLKQNRSEVYMSNEETKDYERKFDFMENSLAHMRYMPHRACTKASQKNLQSAVQRRQAKRVYGKAAFGKRVDMPFDSISAISLSAMKGIAVATSSGKIAFKFIRNNREVHTEISKLLIDRQSEKRPVANGFVNSSPDAEAELKEYKALLDSGVITQEEFEIKKKQILNL